MRLRNLALVVLVAIPLTLNVGCSESTSATGGPPDPYASNICVGAKQAAASTFCKSLFDAWETWETDQNDEARNAAAQAAGVALGTSWDAAEADAASDDANCSDLALTSSEARSAMETAIGEIAGSINEGLDLDNPDQAACGAALIAAAGDACEDVLTAESAHISDLYADSHSSTLDAAKSAASDAFSAAWADATSGNCPTNSTEQGIGDDLESLTGALVENTIVTPLLPDAEYSTLTPGPTDYLGRTYEPQCMQGSEYRYFAKRGSVNKVLIYYQGGGACWNNLTCGVPVCKDSTENDDPNSLSAGFADLTNPNNPFRDWNIVYVSYCTCDVHFGDATQDYEGLTVQHKGYHNAKVAEKWAREHFLNPEEVFVTGSSAGAYGAWFNAPLLHEVWPASQVHVLADAGNGVITQDFLDNEFSNWNFLDNLPDIPGVREALEGDGMPGYTAAVAKWAPDTNWAHYSTMFDGGQGGQTGFYNVMLTESPLGALTWWEASCQFGATALQQSEDTSLEVPDNYRYYFGTGSRHTMFGSDKVYDDITGGVPTIVDWIDAMLASGADGRDENWYNVVCEDCGLLLEGDPAPDPLAAPFELRGEDTVIVCGE